MNKMKLWYVLPALLAVGLSHAAPAQKLTGLKNPESVVVGADGRLYVSEIGEFGKDGDGQVTVIENGKARPFATGMDDPKGMAFFGNDLYVADKTRVLRVGVDGQWEVLAPAEAFPSKPYFLNDVETDTQGNVYVSDSGDQQQGKAGAIYRINRSSGKVARVIGDHDRLKAPNGLLMDGQSAMLSVDFSTGVLYRIKLRTGEMEKIAEGFGGGDGIVRGPGGTLYVSDWKNGKVYSVSKAGEVKLVRDEYMAAADIGLSKDGKFVLVPDMKAGELDWLAVGK